MKMFSKAMAVLCGLTLAASAVSAISACAVENVTQAETNDAASQANKKAGKGQKSTEKSAEKSKEKNVKIGKVTAVNGNVITVSLGEFNSQWSDTIDSGTAAADGTWSKKQRKSSENVADDAGNQTAQKRNSKKSTNDNYGDNASEQSQMAQKRRGKSGRSGAFTENGTTLKVTITDSVTIEKKGEAIAISDIIEGDLLKLVYDENDNLVKVKYAKNKSGHSKGTGSHKITGQAAES